MSRVLALAVFGLLVVGLFLAPAADPARLAATQVGDLIREPIRLPLQEDGEVVDWRTIVGPGDVLVDGRDRARTVDRVEGDIAFLEREDDEPEAVPLADLEWKEGRPLWRVLASGAVGGEREDGVTEVRIRGSLMRVVGGSVDDLILHDYARQSVVRALRSVASEEDFVLDAVLNTSADFPGAGLETRLGPDYLELEVLEPDGTTWLTRTEYHPPSPLSLLPPLVAIFLAILFRQPVIALAAGVLIGSYLVRSTASAPFAEAALQGTLDFGRKYFWHELTDTFRIEIVLFVVFMLAMVGVITRAGGIHGLMDRLGTIAKDLRRTQIATWLMGLAVFFDDYANTILVGSTMRPLGDRFRMAREKLAYIVDSTAAPVAGISIFSTWIAFEVSTFSAQLPDAGLAVGDGYAVFLQTLPYRFYCLLTLFMVGLLVFSGRSFGPMLAAEERALGGKLMRDGAKPMVSKEATDLTPAPNVRPRARVALVPLAVFILGTLFWIFETGGLFEPGVNYAALSTWTAVLYDGSGSTPLMVGALAGLVVAVVLAWAEGLTGDIPRAAWSSVRSMGIAIVILFLAWMIGAVCADLGTATYLSVLAREGMPAIVLPLVLFVLSSVVAFSTGSSWSTMTILLPIVVGLAYGLGEDSGIGGLLLVVMSIGAVLEGAIFGDHCSPISDTTVMSSIASASDHIDHVRTQAPYAILTMSVALLCGYFPAAFFADSAGSWLPYACLALGAGVLTAVVFLVGRKPRAPEPDLQSEPQPASTT